MYRIGLVLAAIAALALARPDEGHAAADNRAAASEILTAVGGTFGDLDLAQLLAGEQVIEGEQGSVTIALPSWRFDQYSPDGRLVLDGELILNLLAQPIALQGELEVSGTHQGTMLVNMTIDLSEGMENPNLGGTLNFNGEEFEIAELLEVPTMVRPASWGQVKSALP